MKTIAVQNTTIVSQLLEVRPDLLPVFWRNGLYAVGAPYMRNYSLEQICDLFIQDADALVEALNRVI